MITQELNVLKHCLHILKGYTEIYIDWRHNWCVLLMRGTDLQLLKGQNSLCWGHNNEKFHSLLRQWYRTPTVNVHYHNNERHFSLWFHLHIINFNLEITQELNVLKHCLHILKLYSRYCRSLVFWADRENHRITPTQCGADRSVRLLLTKNPSCSFSYLMPERRYLVWTVPATLEDRPWAVS